MSAYPISEYLGEDTYRLTDRFRKRIARSQWLLLSGSLVLILFFGSLTVVSWTAFHLATRSSAEHVVDMIMFVVLGPFTIAIIVSVIHGRESLNPFSRPWLYMTYKLEEHKFITISSSGEETTYEWNELSTIEHVHFYGHCLVFRTKENVFVGRLAGRDFEAIGPLAKAIRDAVRHYGKGDLLVLIENWERNNISAYNQIPKRRLFLYAQTPAFTLFLIGAVAWMFEGATTAFYNYLIYGALSIPVMALLVRVYRKRTLKAVARFEKRLDEDKAGSTSVTDDE